MSETETRQPVSIVIPVFNEEVGLEQVLKDIQAMMQREHIDYELIVVDDGSTDKSVALATGLDACVIKHPENIGYGASLKTGIMAAKHNWIVITDGDGSYDINAIPTLLNYLGDYHMVVGARQGKVYSGSLLDNAARRVFRFLSEFATGRSIPDVNSGLRAFRKDIAVRFFDILGNRFSFTTTITLAFMQRGYFVKYVPVSYFERKGGSKVRHYRDTLRALQAIVQAMLYYNPLKLFLLPTSFLAISGIGFLASSLIMGNLLLLACGVALTAAAVVVSTLGLIADLMHRERAPR